MGRQHFASRKVVYGIIILVCPVAVLLVAPEARTEPRKAEANELRIGSSSLAASTDPAKDKGAIDSLESFIKSETGMDSKILRQKTWREVADKMESGEFQLGVFLGYEYAWASEGHARLKPLAVAVNVYRYPVVYVVTRKGGPAKDFAGLRGQSVCLPAVGEGYLRLFLERQAGGKKPEEFFSKVVPRDNIEDALDDVVDGAVGAAAVDKAALEAFKRRKPGRFKQLQDVAHSQPLPPPVVAYQEGALPEGTLARFRDGLLNAGRKERGQTMLTLFRLTGFEAVPADFDEVVARTRKDYPPPGGKTK